MAKLPAYAAKYNRSQLVRVYSCTGCFRPGGGSVLARLSHEPDVNDQPGSYRGYVAICLKCGCRNFDNYNWTPA